MTWQIFEDFVAKKTNRLKFWLKTCSCLPQFQGCSHVEWSANHVTCPIYSWFISVAKIFRRSSSIKFDPYYVERSPKSFFFPVNTNTKSLSQNSISLIQQPEVIKSIDSFNLAAFFYLGLVYFDLFHRGFVIPLLPPLFW